MRFWDSSAIVPLLVDQPMSASIVALHASDPKLVVWWGTIVECSSAIARLNRTGDLGDEDAHRARMILEPMAETWIEVEPTASLRELACRLVGKHDVTTGDALQLAAALCTPWRGPRALEFVCLDRRLRAGADREGFAILPE